MLRINHTADGHYRRDRADEFFSSLAVLAQYAQEADLNILAGDLFDYPVQNTGAAQFPDLAKTLKELSKKSPLVMVEGTESHDSDGCLNVFETISDKITVLRLGETYILNKRRGVIHTNPLDISAKREDVDDIALIFGIPEPRKKWLVASDRDVTLDQMMHTILAGYAAIRLRYPQLPCILVYHGHVLGSKMPNGESVDDGVRIDDLAMVGADYIALGDIHKPQRVGEKRGLNAYYAGSMFATKDWNEADIEFGFNRVYIDKGNVSVERIPYPHPVYRKIEKKAGEPISLSEIQLGAKIWVEIKATAQEALSIDRRALKDELISAGAHDESRVTIKPIPTETVRAGEITVAKHLRGKYIVWADNSKQPYTETMLEKCDYVENESAGKDATQGGGVFTFDYLRLRGAKGLWKKQRKDEIVLDLASYDAGIIGLIGPNGQGKSTIFNAFHMWSEFPSYPGPAYRCFRLKDSVWEVIATDHATKTQYRKRILMDPTLKTPSAKYYLDTRLVGTEEWTPLPQIDGSLNAYNNTVQSIFGSLELYIRTAYQMQEPTADYPDIAKANKNTKKTIMSELAGLKYSVYKKTAETARKAIENIVKEKETKIEVLSEHIGFREALETEISDAKTRIVKVSAELAMNQEALTAASEALAVAQRRSAEMKGLKDRIDQINDLIRQDREAILEHEGKIETFRRAIEGKPLAEKTIEKYQALKDKEYELIAERTQILEEEAKIKKAYHKQKEEYDKAVRAIERELESETNRLNTERNNLKNEVDKISSILLEDTILHNVTAEYKEKINAIKDKAASENQEWLRERSARQHDIDLLEHDIIRYRKELEKPIEDHCPTCKQVLPAKAIDHIKAERANCTELINKLMATQAGYNDAIIKLDAEHTITVNSNAAELSAIEQVIIQQVASKKKEYQSLLDTQRNEIEALDAKQNTVKADILQKMNYLTKPEEPEEPEDVVGRELQRIKSELSEIDILAARQVVETAKRDGAIVVENEKAVAILRNSIERNETQKNDLHILIDETVESTFMACELNYNKTNEVVRENTALLARAKADLDHGEKAIIEHDKTITEINLLKGGLKEDRSELAEWMLLEKAFSQDGIAALELDAICPSVAETASEILRDYEDGRYSIRFDTTRIGGKGNQIEDFLITIVDSLDGDEQDFFTLSPGEAVWFRKALQDAFGIIRGDNANIKYLLWFVDEGDSKLSPEARIAYFRMLESAHTVSTRRYTVLITHSQEIRSMLAQVIDVTKLNAEKANNRG